MRIEKEVKSMAEGLNKMLSKYGAASASYTLEGRVLTIGNERVSLFPWRSEPRFQEMKKLMTNGVIGSIGSIRAMRTAPQSESLEEVLYREIDLCLWWAEKKLHNVFAVINDRCANVILRFEDNAVCIIEAASTLMEGSEVAEHHEIVTNHGLTMDQPIDTLVKQQSVYAFLKGQPAAAFTDTDFELYGLTPDQVALTRTAYNALCGRVDAAQTAREDARVRTVLAAVRQSAADCAAVLLEEGKE